jgi:hypothetical protein
MAARPGSKIRLRCGGSVETLDGAVDDSFFCQVRGLRVLIAACFLGCRCGDGSDPP